MSKYASYSPEKQEELLSNYLIDSWSYSRVSLFARNEKEFERTEIYREGHRRSASSVAGNAYHKALEFYFANYKEKEVDILDIEATAYLYIEEVGVDEWKIQKTTPSIEECKKTALNTVNKLLLNFMAEKSAYDIENIAQVLGIEVKYNEWLTVSGVDIPLPCHGVADLVLRMNDGRVVIIDHKSKAAFTDDKEAALTHGKQAIVYTLLYESFCRDKEKVDEVWFIENKASKNKDGSAQLKRFEMKMDTDSRKLYEALLYEPLRQMCLAVSNPDYVYTINDSDNFCDKAELYEFWMRTLIAEVDDFLIPANKRSLIEKRLKKIRDTEMASVNPKVIANFRKSAAEFIQYDYSTKDMTDKEKTEHVLRSFGIITEVAHQIDGWSSDTFLLSIQAGVKIGSIEKYKLDIANALNVPTVRVSPTMVMYEGKSYLSVEKSKKRERDLLYDNKYLQNLRMPVGLDNFNNTVIWNLDNQSTPHCLVCGATGSGKSVMLRSTIRYARAAGVEVVVLDPKYEFDNLSNDIQVLSEIDDIELFLNCEVLEMQKRTKSKVSNLKLIVFDEFADAQDQSIERRRQLKRDKTESDVMPVEASLKMLLQKGRSAGYRIIAATQRASVKVINGDMKVNFPVQICFRVPKSIDSKVVIDEEGAESLSGAGDGLIKSPEYLDSVTRFQGFY